MANMSYCRFENTSLDLHDCVEVMRAVYNGDKSKLVLSDSEIASFNALAELCREYLEMQEFISDNNLLMSQREAWKLQDEEEEED